MVSAGTVGVIGAVAFAGAAGGYFLYSKSFHVSLTQSSETPTGTFSFKASGATPTGYYTLNVLDSTHTQVAQLPVQGQGTTGSSGTFDANGAAQGTVPVADATSTLPAGSYYFAVTDQSTMKTATAAFTLS